MSQHDLVLDNGPGLAVRTDMIAALQALASNNSGPTEPATPYAGQFWLDTTVAPNGAVMMRNQANSAWIKLFDVVPGAPPASTVSPTADMSTRYRTAPNRWVVNDAADGSGTDLFSIGEDGTITSKLPDGSTQKFQAATASGKNLIINPSFEISQEQGTAVVATSGVYPADQWTLFHTGLGTCQAQSAIGAADSYGRVLNVTATASPPAGAQLMLTQRLEGLQIADLKWGTANARPAVLSFKAQATIAGTYSVMIRNAGGTQSFVHDFVLAAMVTTDISVVIPAQTAGTWANDSTAYAADLNFVHTVGSTYKAPAVGWNAGNYFAGPGLTANTVSANNSLYIREVQLRPDPGGAGRNPGFVRGDYGAELVRCQRYYQKDPGTCSIGGNTPGAGTWYGDVQFATAMRAAPTTSITHTSSSNVSGMAVDLNNPAGFRYHLNSGGAGSFYSTHSWISISRL